MPAKWDERPNLLLLLELTLSIYRDTHMLTTQNLQMFGVVKNGKWSNE